MALSRRQFVQTAGLGAGAALTANVWGRGRENSIWSAIEPNLQAVEHGVICVSSNENPVGPGEKVLGSLRSLLEGGKKPGRYSNQVGELTESIAAHFKVKTDNVLVSEGSTEILRAATQVFTSKTKALVGTIPTYEECAGYAELIGNPVRGVKLNSEFKIDLDQMLAAAKGAGLVFYCNPNNPTATYVGAKATRDFLQKLNAASPDTTILVDEAYFDYVTDPDHETHVPIAIENPHVIVARTFSKAYGLAGFRLGVLAGNAEQMRLVRRVSSPYNVNGVALACLPEALDDREYVAGYSAEVRDGRRRLEEEFAKLGIRYWPSQANFVLAKFGEFRKPFVEAMRSRGILVRDRNGDPGCQGCVRITVGTTEQTDRLLRDMRAVLQSIGWQKPNSAEVSR